MPMILGIEDFIKRKDVRSICKGAREIVLNPRLFGSQEIHADVKKELKIAARRRRLEGSACLAV
jgi:hypothetical protein